jgi:hypothetical protein
VKELLKLVITIQKQMTKSCFLFFLPLLPLPPLQIPYPQKHTLEMKLFLASLLPSSDKEKKLCTSNFKQGLFHPKKRKQNPQLFSKSELCEFLAPSNLRKSSRKILVWFFEIRINPHPVFRISCTICFSSEFGELTLEEDEEEEEGKDCSSTKQYLHS